MKQQYIIKWETQDGASGQGTKPVSKTDAEAWCELQNERYPTVNHWAEPANAETAEDKTAEK